MRRPLEPFCWKSSPGPLLDGRAVHGYPGVTADVEEFHRAAHHPECHLPVCERQLRSADAGRAVPAHGGDGLVRARVKTVTYPRRQLRCVLLDLSPCCHDAILSGTWR